MSHKCGDNCRRKTGLGRCQTCVLSRTQENERIKQQKAQRRADGVCIACGVLAPAVNAQSCADCLAEGRRRYAARRRKQGVAE